MQLVLSNNRILAHGENFLAMGGVVINTETGVKYENATVAECSGCPSDIGVVGYEYHAGRFVPCAPFGVGTGNVAVYCDDCKTPRDSGISIDELCFISSYLAFVGNVNEEMVAAAFGKNNENLVKNIGKQLAMYGWYKGDNNSYTDLQKMLTINDMNNAIYDEIIKSDNLCDLIFANEYATSKFVESHSFYNKTVDNNVLTQNEEIIVTNEDLSHDFRYTCTYNVIGGVNNSEAYAQFNGVKILEYLGGGSTTSIKGIKKWSDFGITSPGTYPIKLYVLSERNGAGGELSFTIYKIKQSYDV